MSCPPKPEAPRLEFDADIHPSIPDSLAKMPLTPGSASSFHRSGDVGLVWRETQVTGQAQVEP